jgi:hypothetical protein
MQPLLLHEQTETPRGLRSFRDQYESTGLAIQAIRNRDLTAVCDFKREQLT